MATRRAQPLPEESLVAVPLPNGAYALMWVMEVLRMSPRAAPSYSFFVMDGFWQETPRATALDRAKPWRRKDDPSLLPDQDDRWKGWFQGRIPPDFAIVGRRKPSAAERAIAAEGSGTMVFQDAEQLRSTLHREWRLLHDREAIEAEWARASEKRARAVEARRRGLTLGKMLREKPFARAAWSPRIVREVRRIFRDATRALMDLDAKGTSRQRSAALRRIVTELNALDDPEGFIETPEREAFVARVEELARLVGLSNAGEKLTGHRDW
jgi:hypothetical protein